MRDTHRSASANMARLPLIVFIVLVVLMSLAHGALIVVLLPTSPALAQTDSPTPAPGCAELSGSLSQQTYMSAVLRREMSYTVYLPPCYAQQAARLYPVVYLMHGSDATSANYWLDLGLQKALDEGITAGWLPPMIVVLPFGDWIANQNQFGAVSWGNIFLTELLPHAESRFRIDARRETRAIGGISRGGFWAFNLAFLHPEWFGTLGGHSAFFHPDHLRSHNPLFLAESAPQIDTLRIWMDYGQYDYALPNGDLLHRRLEARGVPHVYMIYPEGRHNRDYWAAHLSDYLLFYGLPWLTPIAPTPTPTPPALGRPAQIETGRQARLFVPAVGYRSRRASLPADALRAVLGSPQQDSPDSRPDSELNGKLILDTPTADALTALGARLDPAIRRVPPGELLALLERDRSLWTIRDWADLTLRFRVLRVDEMHPVDYLLDGDAADYPLAFAGEPGSRAFDPARLTRLTFSGVTAMVRDTASAIDANGAAWAAAGLRGFTRRADFFHISNEVSFYESCPQWRGAGQPRGPFCAKDSTLDVLSELGTDIIELSGNHNLDFGAEAYLRSLGLYRERGMQTVGGGATLAEARQPLRLTHNGNRIALLACNWAGPEFALASESRPGAAFCDGAWLAEALPRLRADHDVVIMTVQYREFDLFVPTAGQRADFRKLADLGADVVIGTQAHVPQTFEFYPTTRNADTTEATDEAMIWFGLGNVYFDQTYFQMRFFMPTVYVYNGRAQSVDLFVGIIDDFGRPRPMDDHNRAHFLGHMFAR